MFRYNTITAADEKIPLSMVRVNKKPQYLVFCLRFPHLSAKYSQLPVESSQNPRQSRTFIGQTCPLFDAIQPFPVAPALPLVIPLTQLATPKSKIKPSPDPTPPQDATSVQFLVTPV